MSNEGIFIFEVSEHNFEKLVVQNSYKLPVFVEFMAISSGPCIQMSDEISALAHEFSGDFIFAKIDIDEQLELVKKFDIKNVPSLKVFVNGEVVQTEEGQLTQQELRAVLKPLGVYSQADEMRLQARHKHMAGDTLGAIEVLTQAMLHAPTNIKVAMDMVQIFIDLNELEQAEGLFNQLPDHAKNSEMGKALIGQLTFLSLASKTKGKLELENTLQSNPNDCDAHFDLSVCLIAEKKYEQAVSQLFEIMQINTNYKDGAAREMIINVTNMLAPNSPQLASEFRNRLSATVFT